MQNFGHLTSAGNSIGTTFSVGRIMKKFGAICGCLKTQKLCFEFLLITTEKI